MIKQILIENKRIVVFSTRGVMSSNGGEHRVERMEWSVWRGLERRIMRKMSWVLL